MARQAELTEEYLSSPNTLPICTYFVSHVSERLQTPLGRRQHMKRNPSCFLSPLTQYAWLTLLGYLPGGKDGNLT